MTTFSFYSFRVFKISPYTNLKKIFGRILASPSGRRPGTDAPPPLPPLATTLIAASGEGGGRQNPTKENGAPLFFIKIVKYCGVRGGGAPKSYKSNARPHPLSVSKIVKYCGVWGGGALEGAKILQKIMAPPLSVIKIVKYCGVGKGGGRQNPTKIIASLIISVIKIVQYFRIVGGRLGGGR